MASLLVASGFVACTLLVDRDPKQCQNAADCQRLFGTYPTCENHVCVASGLNPPHCFGGGQTPVNPQDFKNQCTRSDCIPFDNCARLSLCDGGVDDVGLAMPPTPDAGPPADAGPAPDGGPVLPSCLDPNEGRAQVVYITGSSNFPPLLAKLAPLLVATGVTPVYQVTSSCNGVKSAFSTVAKDHLITDPAPGAKTAAATFATAAGTLIPCSLGSGGVAVDVGESDIFSTSCAGGVPPNADVGEFLGPIQAMLFVVPGLSREVSISAEAARSVFGRGGDAGNVAPWTNPLLYFVRNANTGTQQMIGRAINVGADQFWGVDRGSGQNVHALLRVIQDDASAQQAIGIISNDFYDSDRGNLKALAFKQTDQTCGYLADSTLYRRDKRNVRDGHYPIWGPLHFFTAVSHGVPISAGAQAFVSTVSVPDLQKELLDAFIDSGLVPSCAMSVRRDEDLGNLAAYSPPVQCNCYFEARSSMSNTAPPECVACVSATDCKDPRRPACNVGFCEMQ